MVISHKLQSDDQRRIPLLRRIQSLKACMPTVFISYRRDDNAYAAHMIRARLAADYGNDYVFMDIDSIPLGVDFRHHIVEAVGKCDVFVAVIGQNWLGKAGDSATRRIDDPNDFVRIELETALSRGIPLIPVLVGNAQPPNPDDLPPSLRDVAFRHAAEVRSGKDADAHLSSLSRGVARHFSTLPVSPETSGAEASTDGAQASRRPLSLATNSRSPDAPGAPAVESLQALRGAAARYGAREYIADGETVPLTAYPSLVDVALFPAGEVRTGRISLTPGRSLDLRFKDAVVGFGIYYKQGLYPSNFNIYLRGGTQKVLVGEGYFPETGFVAEVSVDPIERVIIQPQAQGILEITGIYIFAKGQHERVL